MATPAVQRANKNFPASGPAQQAQQQPQRQKRKTTMDGFRPSIETDRLIAAAALHGMQTGRTPSPRTSSGGSAAPWPWSRVIQQGSRQPQQQQQQGSVAVVAAVAGVATVGARARSRSLSASSFEEGATGRSRSASSSSTGSASKNGNNSSAATAASGKATATMTSEAYTKMVEEAEAQIRALKQKKALAQQKAARTWKTSAGAQNAGVNATDVNSEVSQLHAQLMALKKQTRALKNKASAMRCREKKRRRMEDLVTTVSQLREQIVTLQQDNTRLRMALERVSSQNHKPMQMPQGHVQNAQVPQLQPAPRFVGAGQPHRSLGQMQQPQPPVLRRPSSAPVSPRFPSAPHDFQRNIPAGCGGLRSHVPSPPVSPRATNVMSAPSINKGVTNSSVSTTGETATKPENLLAAGAGRLMRLATVARMRRPGI